jgi:rubredoxin
MKRRGRQDGRVEPDIADAVEQLRQDWKIPFEVEDRSIRLTDAVNGDPGSAVLRVLGTAQAASPVGAASHSPGKLAVGVWKAPDLYLARWTNGKRWVVGYRLPGGAKPNDYVRMEGRIPTRLETDNWYGPVPEAVDEAFLDAGLMLDDPPFPVPPPPPRLPGPTLRATSAAAKAPRAPRAAKPRAAAAAAKPEPAPTARVCPSCGMRKSLSQFVAGSDLCVDCR